MKKLNIGLLGLGQIGTGLYEILMEKKAFFNVFEIALIVGMGVFIAMGLVAYQNPDVCDSLAQVTQTVSELFAV